MRIGFSLVSAERRILSSLAAAHAVSALSALRLATGQRYARPSDGPAAFLQVQAIEREQSAVQSAIGRVTAAANVGGQLELKISSAMTQLDGIRSKVLEDAGSSLSEAERTALQLEIDAAIDQIDDLSRSQIGGRLLLDGSRDYTVTGQNPVEVTNLRVLKAPAETTFSGNVSAAATQASLSYSGLLGNTTSAATFTLTGDQGSVVISVTSGQSLTSVRDAINAVSHDTGVTASVGGALNNTLTLSSQDYGSEATVAVNVTSGTFNVSGGNGNGTANGTDASVTINGQSATNVSGNHVTFAANGLHVSFDVVAGYSGNISAISVADDRVLRFAMGTNTDVTTLALGSIHSAFLGGTSGRLSQIASGGTYAGLGNNTDEALRIVDEAIDELTVIQGQVAAFNGIAVQSSAELLDALDVGLASALDTLNGVDAAQEAAALARSQLLAESALAALTILQEQRANSLFLLQRLADRR